MLLDDKCGLRQLGERGELSKSLDDLCASFVHLHVNRLGGLASLSEMRILNLLLRARAGLHKSPTTKSDSSADADFRDAR